MVLLTVDGTRTDLRERRMSLYFSFLLSVALVQNHIDICWKDGVLQEEFFFLYHWTCKEGYVHVLKD